ncbi:hypothetical protein EHS25_003774 [Saitozyma podzolica]|uniref:Eisosome core component n=1 Tax=Saitozyma podzolica TaxID=1890683 RepID=A0A427Y3H5_9TREE|nr:hypothetical protein EHS25_003774 [Saitozyma podzolica]
MRSASGHKFSLSAFGRKDKDRVASESSVNAYPSSPSAGAGFGTNGNGYAAGSPTTATATATAMGGTGGGVDYNSDGAPSSPTGGPGVTFDGLGRKLGKSIAHQSLLPSLGNKDVRALQDVISSEKGVLNMTEKLALETQKAAASLPIYGQQEGPDLQDILTHSSTLLNHLSTALQVFTGHQAALRSSLKRIRERDEALAELRNRRRNTGNKAENAERKLAKMGPENKSLPQQTDLLERLRQEMRQMDTDIVTEESKLGDFKRQIVKEALSLKFGGLEELGEKMCIIGELGKLLLEEIPLEETPPGYGRAPYTGFDKTENAVNEATKCLSTVQFQAASNAPKPPGLPQHIPPEPLRTPQLPDANHPSVLAAEEYANYPGNLASPVGAGAGVSEKGKARDSSLDENPYGGLAHNTSFRRQPDENHVYREYGGVRDVSSTGHQVMWQGPTEDAVNQIPTDHAYEYEQQREMDQQEAAEDLRGQEELSREEEAWKSEPSHYGLNGNGEQSAPLPNPHEIPMPSAASSHVDRPWEPLNLKRDRTPEPPRAHEPVILQDPIPSGPGVIPVPADSPAPHGYTNSAFPAPPMADLQPPHPISGDVSGDEAGYHTPREAPSPLPPTIPSDIPPQSPSISTSGGKISAAAFRRGVKPRQSEDEYGLEQGSGPRRLPVPPMSPDTNNAAALHHEGAFPDATPEAAGAPPSYGHDSLR